MTSGYLVEFFRDALAKGAGCLEARLARVAHWHKELFQHLRSLSDMSPEEAAALLPLTADEAINTCIESNFDVLEYLDHVNKWDYAWQICDYFEGKVGKDRQRITPRLTLQLLEGAAVLTPEQSPTTTPPRSPIKQRPKRNGAN